MAGRMRWTEEELATVQARMRAPAVDADLGAFQRNSGRGLPAETLNSMEASTGVEVDVNGEPIRKPLVETVDAKALRGKRGKLKTLKKQLGAAAKVPTEQKECEALFLWAQSSKWRGELISDYLIHIPNGAYLGKDAVTRKVTMGKLLAIGLQPGAADYLIPVPCWPTPGLWVEMKRLKGSTTGDDQLKFRRRMLKLGWRHEICRGWVEAAGLIEHYLRAANASLAAMGTPPSAS